MAKDYIENLKKSFKYLVRDTAEDYVPETKDVVTNVRDSVQKAREHYQEAGGTMNVARNAMKRNRLLRETSRLTSDLFNRLKTGNIYDDPSNFDDWSVGLDEDYELTSYDDVYTDEEVSIEEVQREESLTEKVSKASGVAQRYDGADPVASATIDSSEAIAISNAETMKALHLDRKISQGVYFSQMTDHLLNISEHTRNMTKYIDDVHKSFVDETLQYYEDHMSHLVEIKGMLRNYFGDEEKDIHDWEEDLSFLEKIMRGDILGGLKQLAGGVMSAAFSPQAYMAMNMMQNQLPMMMEMMDSTDLVQTGFKSFLNQYMGFDIVSSFDEAVAEMDKKRADIANKMSLSSNEFVSQLGHALRDRIQVDEGIDTSQYEKGAMPFDGVTRKAIIEVIPTYLRKIHAELSGQKELIYDYQRGRFTTEDKIRDRFYDDRPDFEGQYGRIARLIERNLDEGVAQVIDPDALEDVTKKLTNKLLDHHYNISDIAAMTYRQFLNTTGMNEDEVSRIEYNMIKSSIMEAKTSADPFEREQFNEIVDEMRDYHHEMRSYYREQERDATLTGLSSLVNIEGEDRLTPHDPRRDLEDVELDHEGLIDTDLTEEEQEMISMHYDTLGTLDYMTASTLGIRDHQAMQRLGISDIDQVRDLDRFDTYDIDNILEGGPDSLSGEAIDAIIRARDRAAESDIVQPADRAVRSTIQDMGGKIEDLQGSDVEDAFFGIMDAALPALGGAAIGGLLGPIPMAAGAVGAGILSQSEDIKESLFGEGAGEKGFVRNVAERFLGEERTDEIADSIKGAFRGFRDTVVIPVGQWIASTFRGIFGTIGDFFSPDTEAEADIEEAEEQLYGEGLLIEPAPYIVEARKRMQAYGEEQQEAMAVGQYGTGTSPKRHGVIDEPEDKPKNVFGRGLYFFSQTDSEYANLEYADSTVSESGCGLMAAAMAVSNILDNRIDPKELVDISRRYKVEDDGIAFEFFADVGRRFNIPVSIYDRSEVSTDTISNVVDNGNMIVSLYEDMSGNLHYILVRKGSTSHFYVDDPIRGKGIEKPKELIYAKSRAFIIFYNEADSESKPKDVDAKRAPSMGREEGYTHVADSDIDYTDPNDVVRLDDYRQGSEQVARNLGELRQQSTIDIDDANTKAVVEELRTMQDQNEILLNGVAWNLEKIKRLMVQHFGDLEGDLRMGDDAIATDRLTRYRGFFQRALERALGIISAPGELIGTFFSKLRRAPRAVIERIFSFMPFDKAQAAFRWIGKTISDAKSFVGNIIPNIASKTQDFVKFVYDEGKSFMGEAYEAGKYMLKKGGELTAKAFDESISLLMTFARQAKPAIREMFYKSREVAGDLYQAGQTMAKDLYSFGKHAGSWLWDTVSGVMGKGADFLKTGFESAAEKIAIKETVSTIEGFSDQALQDLMRAESLRRVYVVGGQLNVAGIQDGSVSEEPLTDESVLSQEGAGMGIHAIMGLGQLGVRAVKGTAGKVRDLASLGLSGLKSFGRKAYMEPWQKAGSALKGRTDSMAGKLKGAFSTAADRMGSISHLSQEDSEFENLTLHGHEFADIGCGPAVLKMLLQGMGIDISADKLTSIAQNYVGERGIEFQYIVDVLSNVGISGNLISGPEIKNGLKQMSTGQKAIILTKATSREGHYVLIVKDQPGYILHDPLKDNPQAISINSSIIEKAEVGFIVGSQSGTVAGSDGVYAGSVTRGIPQHMQDDVMAGQGRGPGGELDADPYEYDYDLSTISEEDYAKIKPRIDQANMMSEKLSHIRVIKEIMLDWYRHGLYMIGDLEEKRYLEQMRIEGGKRTKIQEETLKKEEEMTDTMHEMSDTMAKVESHTDTSYKPFKRMLQAPLKKMSKWYKGMQYQWVWIGGGDLDRVKKIDKLGLEEKTKKGLISGIGKLITTPFKKIGEVRKGFLDKVLPWRSSKKKKKKAQMWVGIAKKGQPAIPVMVKGGRLDGIGKKDVVEEAMGEEDERGLLGKLFGFSKSKIQSIFDPLITKGTGKLGTKFGEVKESFDLDDDDDEPPTGGMGKVIPFSKSKPDIDPVDQETGAVAVSVVNESLPTKVMGGTLDAIGTVGAVSLKLFSEVKDRVVGGIKDRLGMDDVSLVDPLQGQAADKIGRLQEKGSVVAGKLGGLKDKFTTGFMAGQEEDEDFDPDETGFLGRLGQAMGKALPLIKGTALGSALGGMAGTVSVSALGATLGVGLAGLISITDVLRGVDSAEDWLTEEGEETTWGERLAAGGGALVGGAGEGLSNIIGNAIKWGLIGGTIGTMLVPGPFTLGGLGIGAAVGAGLGAIGGERISQAFHSVGSGIFSFLNVFRPGEQAQEWFDSEEEDLTWGERIAAGGGAFLGGSDGGRGNAIGNALKWGGIGAALGSLAFGVGAIPGFGIGAAFGGAMGEIGGDRISNMLHSVGSGFTRVLGWLGEGFLGIEQEYDEEDDDRSGLGVFLDATMPTALTTLAGAAIGTVVAGPGIGTAIGAGIGAVGPARIISGVQSIGKGLSFVGDILFEDVDEDELEEGEDEPGLIERFRGSSGIGGALIGGTLGTLIAPGLGTAIGAGIGAVGPHNIIGALMGPGEALQDAGNWLADLLLGPVEEEDEEDETTLWERFRNVDGIRGAVLGGALGLAIPFVGPVAAIVGAAAGAVGPGRILDTFSSVGDRILDVGSSVRETLGDVSDSFREGVSRLPFIDITEDDDVDDSRIYGMRNMDDDDEGIFSDVEGDSLFEKMRNLIWTRLSDAGDEIVDRISSIPDFFVRQINRLPFIEIGEDDDVEVKDTDEDDRNVFQRGYDGLTNLLSSPFDRGTDDSYDDTNTDQSTGGPRADLGSGMGTGRHIYQRSSRYSGLTIGGQSFGDIGCGPAAVGSALGNLGKDVPQNELARIASKHVSEGGVNFGFVPEIMSTYSIEGTTVSHNIPQVISSMQNGDQAVLLTKKGMNGGHYVTIEKRDGKLTLYDPLKRTPRTITASSSVIQDAIAAYIIPAQAGSGMVTSPRDMITSIGTDTLTGLDRQVVQEKERKAMIDNAREILRAKDKIETIKEIRDRVYNEHQISKSSEPIVIDGSDNEKLEEKVDVMISKFDSLIELISYFGSQALENGNGNEGNGGASHPTSQNVINNVGGNMDEGRRPESVDRFMRQMLNIARGVD